MIVHVTMTRDDGTIETLDCRGWIELAAYLERHHGEYKAVDAHEVKADAILGACGLEIGIKRKDGGANG